MIKLSRDIPYREADRPQRRLTELYQKFIQHCVFLKWEYEDSLHHLYFISFIFNCDPWRGKSIFNIVCSISKILDCVVISNELKTWAKLSIFWVLIQGVRWVLCCFFFLPVWFPDEPTLLARVQQHRRTWMLAGGCQEAPWKRWEREQEKSEDATRDSIFFLEFPFKISFFFLSPPPPKYRQQ